MREIKFRGKQNYGNDWIYGNLVFQEDECFIYPQNSEEGLNSRDHYEVDPKTVGQYTGEKDVDGTEMYEGDMLTVFHHDLEMEHDDTIVYHYGSMYLNRRDASLRTAVVEHCLDFKVKGNIHDKDE